MKPWTHEEEAEAIRSWLKGRSAQTMAAHRGRTVVDVLTKLGELEQAGRMAATARVKQINPSFYISTLKQQIAKYCPAVVPVMTTVSDPEDICSGHHHGNPESVEAFEVTKRGRQEQYKRILEELINHPDGLTVDELKQRTKFKGTSSCGARCSELQEKGAVIPKPDGKGGYVRRKTRSGVNAAVRIINPDWLI
jgi:hypothetical protein